MILVRNHFSFTNISAYRQFNSEAKQITAYPTISILIPARNEEAVIERCVSSCLKQDYPDFEVLVLDDLSDDSTGSILLSLQKTDSRLKIIEGSGPQKGWLGKPRACKQLAENARGEIFVFIDADVWLDSEAISSAVKAFQKEQADALTIWPEQRLISLTERMVVPMVYFALMTMLPAIYVKRDPRWMPPFIRPYFKTAFAAACGQFIAIKKSAYNAIGGHEIVKDQVVEDVELAKALKRHGYTITMHHGRHQVYCRMYTSDEDLFQGFRKNFFAGFGYNTAFFLMAAVLHLVVFVLPYLLLLAGILLGYNTIAIIAAISIVLIHVQRLLIDVRNGWSPVLGITHILGVLWFQKLGMTVLADYFGRREVRWKGRNIGRK